MNGKQAPQAKNYVFVPYSYTLSSAAMNVGASNQQPLLLDQDADFELHEIFGYSSVDNATDFRPNNFSVQITDKNNSRIWSSDPIAQVTISSPPLFIKRPVLLAKRSNLNLNFQNITASTNGIIATVVMHGYKVYSSPTAMPAQLQ